MKTRTYSAMGIFSPLTLILNTEIIVQKRNITYSVTRAEASNILRTAKKRGWVKKIS